MDTCLIKHQQPSNYTSFSIFFAFHQQSRSCACKANIGILKPLNFYFPSTQDSCMFCAASQRRQVPAVFEVRWMRAPETFEPYHRSQSWQSSLVCITAQDTTLNTSQRNLQSACVLMNKDVRAWQFSDWEWAAYRVNALNWYRRTKFVCSQCCRRMKDSFHPWAKLTYRFKIVYKLKLIAGKWTYSMSTHQTAF